MPVHSEKKEEIEELILAVIYPFGYLIVLWVIYLISRQITFDMAVLGLHPLDFKGLIGILTAPLIHLTFDHIASNSLSFFVIGFGLCFLYRRKALPIFFFIYLTSGLWGWFFARDGYHIGASGLIYGMFFFLVTSALVKWEKRTMAFSLLITFLFGAIVWGFFPIFFPDRNISWELHTTGAVAGIIAAFYFRKEGPQKEIPLEEEDEDSDNDENMYWKVTTTTLN